MDLDADYHEPTHGLASAGLRLNALTKVIVGLLKLNPLLVDNLTKQTAHIKVLEPPTWSSMLGAHVGRQRLPRFNYRHCLSPFAATKAFHAQKGLEDSGDEREGCGRIKGTRREGSNATLLCHERKVLLAESTED